MLLDINGLYQILNGTASPSPPAPPTNITISHNTGISTGRSWFATGDNPANRITGFAFENNLQVENAYGFFGDAVGTGKAALAGYYRSPVFTHNVDMGGNAGSYPSGNFFPTSWATVNFVDSTNCPAGKGFPSTYRITICALKSGSPYHHAGTDGRDIGPNIDAIDAATAGVAPERATPGESPISIFSQLRWRGDPSPPLCCACPA
jgi:hypothetical protein